MSTPVDVKLIEGLGLRYEPGAEAGLQDLVLDPTFDQAWRGFLELFPGQTLRPLFDDLPVEQLADLLDGVRLLGEEPPNPFVWFTLDADDADVDALVAALLTLPMVVFAERRPQAYLATAASYGTNPLAGSEQTFQILPAPFGIDAVYAWQIPGGAGKGVRVGVVDNGWRLDHEELSTAQIVRRSVFGSPTADDIDHGAAAAGILVGADNGLGTIGIVPDAALDLFSQTRADGRPSVARAIAVAAAALTAGDVLLLELADSLPGRSSADIPLEFDLPVQEQIRLAVQRGITVIEPAGNREIDLDAFPFLAHTRPGAPGFSGAIVVGAALDSTPVTGNWFRNSAFGSRVDCFAAGSQILAPSATATNAYQEFSGTSGASAIVAGVAASLQAMTRAATGRVLLPADVRRLLSSARLGTLPTDPLGANIGSMPDLRKIARAQGLRRILPVGAAWIGGNSVLMVHLDSDNRMVRRLFAMQLGYGWLAPLTTPTPDGSVSPYDLFELGAAQPAVTVTSESVPAPVVVEDAFFSGPDGIHAMTWDTLGRVGNVIQSIAPRTASAQGKALAAIRVDERLLVLAAVNPDGQLVVLWGDARTLHTGLSGPFQIDLFGRYRRTTGPTITSRGTGLVDVVAIEDGGALNWFTGGISAAGPLILGPFTTPAAVPFDPGARPALLSSGSLLLAAAVGADGSLRVQTIDAALLTVAVPVEVDPSVSIARSGPIGLARTATSAVVVAVDSQGVVRAATRPLGGGSWTPLIPLMSPVAISPLGGVTVVSIEMGVMALAVGIDGVVCSALSTDGLLWSPLIPLP